MRLRSWFKELGALFVPLVRFIILQKVAAYNMSWTFFEKWGVKAWLLWLLLRYEWISAELFWIKTFDVLSDIVHLSFVLLNWLGVLTHWTQVTVYFCRLASFMLFIEVSKHRMDSWPVCTGWITLNLRIQGSVNFG